MDESTGMNVKSLTPILNVSSLVESIAWFEKLGWKEGWRWGEPPTFGGVVAGQAEIFLCQNCQGGKGRSPVKETFGEGGTVTGDKGCWISLFVDDVDAVHQHCVEQGIEVAFPPTDMEWNVREMHVRHPDGHVFRIGSSLEEDE
jgi:catechol 2,3-dioxygenase-like lactoylglutathione lyase family enzyme